METHSEKIPEEMLKVTSAGDVTPRLLALAKQHCAGRLSRAMRQAAGPLPLDFPILQYSMQIGSLCHIEIPGEMDVLSYFAKAEEDLGVKAEW